MSLLIKALDKAQAEKAQSQEGDAKSEKASTNIKKTKKTRAAKQQNAVTPTEALSLSPQDESLTEVNESVDDVAQDNNEALPVSLQDSATANETPASKHASPELTIAPIAAKAQAQAANVFSSKRIEPKHQTAKIAMMLGLLALAILAVFAYWYQFVFNQPDVVIPPRPAAFDVQVSEPTQLSVPPQATVELTVDDPVMSESDLEIVESEVDAEPLKTTETSVEPTIVDAKSVAVKAPVATKSLDRTSVFNEPAAAQAVEETLADNEQVITADNADELALAIQSEASTPVSQSTIKITQKKTENGVNAILMRAYQAYNSGNDEQAQTGYKTVLQRYGLNVDAMLGLGAIATRQGRNADAQGWYQKVLQVEPRNEVAKAGLLSLQGDQQQGLSLSQIKSMLQASPTDANLQATLGDMYAQQGQWPDAQQAYFEAYRLKQSAENAFNLAVSLDQMGKANIALPYYKEAQMKADQSSVIDKAALDARISSIE